MFECLNDAVQESESLLSGGYVKSGNWTLAQISCHLRLTIEGSLMGYPRWMVIIGYPDLWLSVTSISTVATASQAFGRQVSQRVPNCKDFCTC